MKVLRRAVLNSYIQKGKRLLFMLNVFTFLWTILKAKQLGCVTLLFKYELQKNLILGSPRVVRRDP